MHLFRSTTALIISGTPYSDLPILISNDGSIHTQALDFCVFYCIKRGRIASKKTWGKYGQDLYDFFSWTEANNLDWASIDNPSGANILAAYRDWSLGPEVKNSSSTVNQRLRLLISFYKYAHKRGWVSKLPYEIEHVFVKRNKDFLVHTDRSGGKRASADIMLKTHPTIVRVLTRKQARSLIAAIKNNTHRLIARLALGTGMRREELATFPTKYVINPRLYKSHDSIIRVNLDPREMSIKGGKQRGIDVPRTLMEDLWQYVIRDRNALEQATNLTVSPLFLRPDGNCYQNDGKAFSNIIKAAGTKIGLDHVTPHVLRHTYATQTLYFMQKAKAQTSALMYVRDRLGHSSINTTERYLHLLSQVEEDLMDAYQEDLDDMLGKPNHA